MGRGTGGTGGRGDLGRICKPHKFLLSLCKTAAATMLLPFCKIKVGWFGCLSSDSRGLVKEDVCFSRALLLVFSPPALSGDGKTTLAPPRGVRAWRWKWPVAPSCQKRVGETGGEAVKRRGKGANFIPTAANRGVAFLFGHSPVWVPYDQFLLPIRRHPLLLSPSVPPALPRAPLGKAREAEETPGARNSRRERGGRKGQKLCAAGEKKVFWWRRVSCRARRWLAARASFPFPFPWSGPRAGDAGGEERRCRLRGCPGGGRPVTSVGDTQPARVALPRRCKNAGCRLSAHTSAAEGHFFNAGKTHSRPQE